MADRRASNRAVKAPPPGLAARAAAARILGLVLRQGTPLSGLLDGPRADDGLVNLAPRDRALARMIVFTGLRRLGEIDAALKEIYAKGVPARAGALRDILRISAAQILFLDVPGHAAVDIAVRLALADDKARHYRPMVNAGLRKLAARADEFTAHEDAARRNTPRWLWDTWTSAYGAETAQRIAMAHMREAPLDLTAKDDPAGLAEALDGLLLPTGSVRLVSRGSVEALPGYREGKWWVQDAAAALPARLLGDVAGKTVIDLCAAPGGKTAQLANAGARVTAVEKSPQRARRINDNLRRLGLDAHVLVADARVWRPAEPADAVLLDAPCTATGTLRRHPDAAWLKSEKDRDALVALQDALLRNAAAMVRPGGLLVYCTCSLDPAESEERIAAFLASGAGFARVPVEAREAGGLGAAITPAGDLRTMPFMLSDAVPALSGMDGFFAARLRRA